MSIFDPYYKPRVTREEFKKVRAALASHDFTERQRNRVEEIFFNAMNEDAEREKGISKEEIEASITWLREHTREHDLTESKISILEAELKKYL